jgi:hypothetical protein
MRKIVLFGVVIALLFNAPLLVSAQGFGDGFNLGPFGMYLGNALARDDTAMVGVPVLYVGWVDHARGLNFSFDYSAVPYYEDLHSPFRGLWLGVAVNLLSSNRLGFTLSGGALIANNASGSDHWTDGSVSPPTSGTHELRNSSQWSIVDALGTYRVYGGTALVGGFRWDYFSHKHDNVDSAGFSGETHYKINAYLPVVGIQVQEGNSSSRVLARIIGFPAAPGAFKYAFNTSSTGDDEHETFNNNWKQGYFLECLLSFQHRVTTNGLVGAFCSYYTLHTVSGMKTYDYNYGGDIGSGPLEFTAHRQTWTLGGSLALEFQLL